jgi:hypothetical protein
VSGRHVDRLLDMLPLYCDLTRCRVGDGKRTAFWLDTWVNGAQLAVQFASLFSHALDKTTSVHAVLSRGVWSSLVTRLNATGDRQLPPLLALVCGVALTDEEDGRALTHRAKPTGALDEFVCARLEVSTSPTTTLSGQILLLPPPCAVLRLVAVPVQDPISKRAAQEACPGGGGISLPHL